ncbi:MAG: hypothetical protein PHX78_02555 [bacterium]|nr:hypothetical protein [bacterium]
MVNKKNQNEELWYYATITIIIFIIIGLTISIFEKKEITEKSYNTAALEKVITPQSKVENITAPGTQPKGKVISPESQYDIEQLRKSLNLPEPEEEKKAIKQQHEEILKNNSQVRYVF